MNGAAHTRPRTDSTVRSTTMNLLSQGSPGST
jgi:hypothetical protein